MDGSRDEPWAEGLEKFSDSIDEGRVQGEGAGMFDKALESLCSPEEIAGLGISIADHVEFAGVRKAEALQFAELGGCFGFVAQLMMNGGEAGAVSGPVRIEPDGSLAVEEGEFGVAGKKEGFAQTHV